jgi:glycosyltransferase involved in cell wall biosynthesis
MPPPGTAPLGGASLPPGVEVVEADSSAALATGYATAWVSVLASLWEAQGLVLTESLAAGTPVVAARSGACPEIVSSDRVGRLFEADDEEGLAKAILEAFELAQDDKTADACRERAAEFDWTRLLPRYEEAYEQALAGAR